MAIPTSTAVAGTVWTNSPTTLPICQLSITGHNVIFYTCTAFLLLMKFGAGKNLGCFVARTPFCCNSGVKLPDPNGSWNEIKKKMALHRLRETHLEEKRLGSRSRSRTPRRGDTPSLVSATTTGEVRSRESSRLESTFTERYKVQCWNNFKISFRNEATTLKMLRVKQSVGSANQGFPTLHQPG